MVSHALLTFASNSLQNLLGITVNIVLEVHAVIGVLKRFNIIVLRRSKSISADSLALCTFNRGKKKIKTKVAIWEDETTQSRADMEIKPTADVF